jgi:transcriptional regulator with XRE-family HTH domain
MEFINSIGERLREERERLGLSQTQMAEIAKQLGAKGATRQSQALYEKGEQTPSAAYISAISTTGADVLYILTGQRAMPVAQATNPREKALLDNYRHSSEEGKRAIEATTAELAKPKAKKASGE